MFFADYTTRWIKSVKIDPRTKAILTVLPNCSGGVLTRTYQPPLTFAVNINMTVSMKTHPVTGDLVVLSKAPERGLGVVRLSVGSNLEPPTPVISCTPEYVILGCVFAEGLL